MWRWLKRIILTALALLFLIALYLLIPVNIKPANQITWGITFTKSYAQYLGLDWRQTYLVALDDLGIKSVRIGVNWDEIEKVPGQFDFTDYDWMMDEAEKRGISILPAIGYKLPRWPECRAPEFAEKWLPTKRSFIRRSFGIGVGPERKKFEEAQFRMLKAVVEHFKDRKSITSWQVENEGFIGWFGDCPPIKDSFIRKEVEFIRALDHRPILMTEAGELSVGLKSAVIADAVGTSLYRKVWNPLFGFISYPLPPSFYAHKARLLKLWAPRYIISELQLEAWAPKGILNIPVEEQLSIMSPQEVRNYMEYARRTGIDEIYTWGVEWWWWMKTKGYPQLWETAREEFAKYQS